MPELRGLRFAWSDGSVLADGLDLAFEPGRVTALVGASGCGKSTLLRLIAGLIQAQEGQVLRGSQPVGFVFQSPTLLPWRTVARNVALPEELGGRVGMSVHEALALVGLQELSERRPWELSGGQRMRVSLARALRGRPGLLLLDEPFASLDALTRRRLQQDFADLQREQDATVVLVTHDLDEAVLLADRVVVLQGPPVRVVLEIEVALPRPRTVHDAAVGQLVKRLEAAL